MIKVISKVTLKIIQNFLDFYVYILVNFRSAMPRLATSQANGVGSSSAKPHDNTGGDMEKKPPSGSNRSNGSAPRSNQGSARSNQGRSSGTSCKPDDKKGSGKKDGDDDDDGNNPGPGMSI